MGSAVGSSRWTMGSLMSVGSVLRMAATRSRTSVVAIFTSASSLNWITTVETESRE